MTLLEQLEQRVLLERLVIGLEEPVLIKGLGELSAKIDSGNGGYNVIHGTDFHQQGDELMFTTHDSFGHEKKMQAKVIDTIEVNMGGGNIENRPVIELDIKFAGEDYKKIPFSVSDRSTNTNPILISKGFVENELEALIDVGAKNISSDGIDVVYGESVSLDQGLISGIKKGVGAVGKIGSGITKGIGGTLSGINKWMKGGDDVNLFAPITKPLGAAAKVGAGAVGGALGATGSVLGGAAKLGGAAARGGLRLGAGALAATGAAIGGLAWLTPKLAKGLMATCKMTWKSVNMVYDFSKRVIKSFNTLTNDDEKAIRAKLPSATKWIATLTKLDAIKGTVLEDGRKSIQGKAAKLFPIVSFSCQKGEIKSAGMLKAAARNTAGRVGGNSFVNQKIYVTGQEQRANTWKDLIQNAKKGVQFIKNNREKVTDNNEANPAQEQEEEIIFKALNESILILEDDTPEGDGASGEPVKPNTPQQAEGENPNASDEQKDKETQEAITSFDNLKLFYLWFISISGQAKDGVMDKALRTMGKEQKDKNSNIVQKTFIKEKTFDSYFSKLYEMGQLTPDKIGTIVKTISSVIKKKPEFERLPLSGMWVLGYSPDPQKPEKRQYVFYQEQDQLIYSVQKEKARMSAKEWDKLFPNIFPKIDNLWTVINRQKDKFIEAIKTNKTEQEFGFDKQDKKSQEILAQIKADLAQEKDPKNYNLILGKYASQLMNAYIHWTVSSELQKTEVGKMVLNVLNHDDKYKTIDSPHTINGLRAIIMTNQKIADIFAWYKQSNGQTQEQEEDEHEQEWISSKLDYLQNKGLI